MVRISIFLLLIIPATIGTALADDFYVNCYIGSNDTGNGSENNPWKTLQFAFDSIEGTEANPHWIHLSKGCYDLPYSYDTAIVPDDYENVRGAGWNETYIYYFWFDHVNNITVENLRSFGFSSQFSADINFFNCVFNTSMYIQDSAFKYNRCLFWKFNCLFHTFKDSTALITNSICYKCNQVAQEEVSENLTINYSFIENGWPGTGNIQGDPMFVDPDTFDFRLRYNSPCIDTGDPASTVPPGGGARIDMGLLEYQHTPQIYFDAVVFTELSGDNDGIPETGETCQPTLTFTNTGEPATNLTLTFEANHPDITMTAPDVIVGSMATDETITLMGPIFTVSGQSGWCSPVELVGHWTAGADNGTVFIPFSLHGNEQHIDPVTGNDETGDGSPENPYKTIGTARDTAIGSRLFPITLRPHAGIYSEDSGEGPWPMWTDEFEDLRGDGPETEIWNLYLDEACYMFLPSRTTNMSDFSFYSNYETVGGMKIYQSMNTLYENLYSDALHEKLVGIGFRELSTAEVRYCNMRSVRGDYSFDESDYNVHHSILDNAMSSTNFIYTHNYIVNNGTFGPINLSSVSGNIITDNVFGGSIEMRNAHTFERNHSGAIVFFSNEAFTIIGNTHKGNYVNFGCSEHINFINNIGLSITNFHNSFEVWGGAGPSYINCAHVSLVSNPGDHGFQADNSSFNINGCISMMSISGIEHDKCWRTRNSSLYYNLTDNGDCINTEYSNAENCPDPTNIDADPGWVGCGTITAIGDTWFSDDTANWEPDKYAGYYVNPNIAGDNIIFYCIGNTHDTIYLDNDPRCAAQPFDRYLLPDIHLRRIVDGFAYDSPLIDAGDPAETDPDGTRRDIGPYGGPYALTPMPVIPTWPAPEKTPTPPLATATPYPTITPAQTSTPSITPSPTSTPQTTGVTLSLPKTVFSSGDTFWCAATVTNASSEPLINHPLFVILDVYGDLFFAPSFSTDLDAWPGPWQPGETPVTVLEPFEWPETGSAAAGIYWYAAITTPDITEIHGTWDMIEFEWRK